MSSANIHAKPSMRSCISSPSCGIHATPARTTPSSLICGYIRITSAALASVKAPASQASALRAFEGISAAQMLPMNGKSRIRASVMRRF
jgi:hypothetical protein